MNTHYLCTQNALHSPASVQITLAGSLPVTQKSTIPLGSEYRNSTDARRTVRITQYRRRRRSKSPARATCPCYRGLRDARRVAVPKTTRAGIAAWRICRYNLDTVPDIHANKAVEAGVQTSCPFQYKVLYSTRNHDGSEKGGSAGRKSAEPSAWTAVCGRVVYDTLRIRVRIYIPNVIHACLFLTLILC